MPLLAEPAAAAEITDAITRVNVVETSINSGITAMRLEVEFDIGPGIGRDGDAQAGDTFWLQLDPRLASPNGTFNIYAVGSTTDVVATVTIVGGGRATFTLTNYVNDRSFTEGAAFWRINFRSSTTPAGPYDLVFETASTDFPDRVVVQSTYVPPADGDVDPPLLTGTWHDGLTQRRGVWKTILPDGPADTLVYESFGWTSGPQWEFDCGRTLANQFAYRNWQSPVSEVSIVCQANYLRWELRNVPDYDRAGQHPVLQVDFNVTDPSTSGDLVFRMQSTYTLDGGTPGNLSGEVRQTRGGAAVGPTTPVAPTVVQPVCVNLVPTGLSLALPLNGNGITYSQNIVNPMPGDTVEVLAELSTDYEWDLPLDPAWEVSGASAVYTVVFDDPDCSISPANPTVTQVACSAGTVVDPDIALPADTPEITYSIDPVDYEAGDTVRVLATLTTTDYMWDTTLPDGWIQESPTLASHVVTLDAADDCRLVATPVSPTVIQTACDVGTQVDPDVQPPADGTGVTYRLEGTIEAGSTVRVIATLSGSQYRWNDTLPPGWVLEAGTLVFTVTLLDPVCIDPVAPVSPTVSQTSCAAGTVVLPVVTPGAATSGIRYAIDGQVQPGATVRVVATLTSAAFGWSRTVPTGWVVDSPNTASYRVVLDSAAGCGGGGGLADTGVDAAVVWTGTIAGGILVLGGLALVLVQLRRRLAND